MIGEEANELYNTFQFVTEENRIKLDVLKSKFEEYVNPRKNTVFERYRFWEYKQQEGETIDQFITELKTRARSFEFGVQHDSMIRDRIVFGVSDTRLKERLLRESSDLTLEKAASLCTAAEVSENQLKELNSLETKPVHAVKSKSKQKPWKKPRQQQAFNCKKCETKHLSKACPAFGRPCLFCKEKNHYARMCPQKNPPVHVVDSSKRAANGGQVESEELFIGTLTGPRSAENSAWFSNLLVGGTTVKFKLIPTLKPTYYHLVFTLNSRTNHRC